MSLRPKVLPEVPEQTAAVARAAFPKGSLPIRVRDRLAEVFVDEPFTGAFGVRGAPGMAPHDRDTESRARGQALGRGGRSGAVAIDRCSCRRPDQRGQQQPVQHGDRHLRLG